MPRSHSLNMQERETVDLHAPWWSPTQDDQGRFVERVVVYRHKLQSDTEWINARIFSGMRTPKKRTDEIGKEELAKTRTYVFQCLIVEMTDETGTPAPMINMHGVRPMLTEKFIRGMEEPDTDFIEEEMNTLYSVPVVPVLASDVDEAEKNVLREHPNPDKHDPEVIASDHFRPSAKGRVPRQS